MAYLHSDREQFRDAIDLAYEQTGVMVQAICWMQMPYTMYWRGIPLPKEIIFGQHSLMGEIQMMIVLFS